MKYRKSKALRILAVWLCVLLLGMPALLSASADVSADGFTFSGGTAMYSTSTEAFVRLPSGNTDHPKNDEYVTFIVDVTNASSTDRSCRDVYFQIDGGEKWYMTDFTLGAGRTTRCHIWSHNMATLSPGSHLMQFYMNGQNMYNMRLYLMRDWRGKMTFPTQSQIASVRNKGRSPYIVFWPMISGVTGIMEYAIDFSVDFMDDGTYFCAMGGQMDLSGFERLHGTGWSGGYFYCGVQCWENGKTGVIMSVWDMVPEKGKASGSIICATQTYPEYRKGVSTDTVEGRFQQFSTEFAWKAQRPYRLLIQVGTIDESGNASLIMWLQDLITMGWTKLVAWDLGYPSRYIQPTDVYGFMENYHNYSAGCLRAVNISNIRCRDAGDDRWVAVRSVNYTVNNSAIELDYNGSYNFGTDDSSFWIITSAVSGLCKPPQSGIFSVVDSSSDSPY